MVSDRELWPNKEQKNSAVISSVQSASGVKKTIVYRIPVVPKKHKSDTERHKINTFGELSSCFVLNKLKMTAVLKINPMVPVIQFKTAKDRFCHRSKCTILLQKVTQAAGIVVLNALSASPS